jgi:formylglycine-generating enzyme required for sulfatase activity
MGFVSGMKITWRICFLLSAALVTLPFIQSQAQDATTPTNGVPTLKDLMATNSAVTNTVGIILVKISPGLWAAKYDTTQDAYQRIMHTNPSAFKGADRPVDSESWNDATDFCTKLTTNEKDQLPDGYIYSLPTQSQWETLVGDASLKDAVMKLNDQSISSTAVVGSLGPNSSGLYDMRGNVWAWCLDSNDPAVRVLRGGAWDTVAEPTSRIVFRWYYSLANDQPRSDFGFRVVLTNVSNPAPTKNSGVY